MSTLIPPLHLNTTSSVSHTSLKLTSAPVSVLSWTLLGSIENYIGVLIGNPFKRWEHLPVRHHPRVSDESDLTVTEALKLTCALGQTDGIALGAICCQGDDGECEVISRVQAINK